MNRELLKASAFLAILGFLAATLVVLVGMGGRTRESDVHRREVNLEVVKALGLSDLSIWTEARYTRHPSQADLFTPFQSVPSALEHFPSGSWVTPPPDHWIGVAGTGRLLPGGGEVP